MANGESVLQICRDPEMPNQDTIYSWIALNRDHEFSEGYARARLAQAHRFADETREIVDTETDPARARVRFDQRRWAAGKLAPSIYGDRVKHDVETTGTVLLVTGVVGPEDIEGEAS